MRRHPYFALPALFFALTACALEPSEPSSERNSEPAGARTNETLAQQAVQTLADAATCPAHGHITYTLQRASAPTDAQRAAYTKIAAAMDKALSYYNCYTDISKTLHVQYEPSVKTADGNANGTIRFGAEFTFKYSRAMHEIAHTVGIGTAKSWPTLVSNGIFTGAEATRTLRAISGKPDDQVHADQQHFWPYGLNYASEVKSEADLLNHCRMVVAIRTDLGL